MARKICKNIYGQPSICHCISCLEIGEQKTPAVVTLQNLFRLFTGPVDDRAFAQRPADQSGAPTAAMRPKSGHPASLIRFPEADACSRQFSEKSNCRVCTARRCSYNSHSIVVSHGAVVGYLAMTRHLDLGFKINGCAAAHRLDKGHG